MKYWEDGYLLLEGAVPQSVLDRYLETANPGSGPSSYLDSRNDYLRPEISRIYECVNSAISEIGLRPMLAEARTHSSRIYWHRDCNQNSKEFGDSYCGAIFALENAEDGSGGFEYIPGSHLWEIDPLVINEVTIRTKQAECFHYYRRLVEEKSPKIELFRHKAGDAMIWHGHLLHRGAEPADYSARRHSLTVHYSGN
jgi:ectoine hydroxylase-related dioxygenase (phytanoyl-CoA dioxygenase family)